ncbi:MAG: hypothetical protein ACR2QJ_17830 [Geminicoccaceae bacterium]
MVFRSLVACTFLLGHAIASTASAQVLRCPEAPRSEIASADISAETERLLQRLTIALDLHGHRGISEARILEAHAETPSALLAKLSNVADRCMMASGNLEAFHAALPKLRKAFLGATENSSDHGKENDPRIKAAGLTSTEAERVELSIDLSVRELWRNLWFRSASTDDDRWAVIVASPEDADSGWDALGRHQRQWKDAYFQLHEPYYDSNHHHAIVVGRRLPEDQATQLRDFVIELGMAEDTYLWQLPENSEAYEARTSSIDRQATEVEAELDGGEGLGEDGRLDLSILDR